MAAWPVPSARLKKLWRELQRTRPTSDRYQELVELIRAESSAHRTPIVVDDRPRPKT